MSFLQNLHSVAFVFLSFAVPFRPATGIAQEDDRPEVKNVSPNAPLSGCVECDAAFGEVNQLACVSVAPGTCCAASWLADGRVCPTGLPCFQVPGELLLESNVALNCQDEVIPARR